MVQIALWEPEIPPNTGNIARLCAATGARLHLIGRLGFRLDDRDLQRAGLDYWPDVDLARHDSLPEFERSVRDRIVCFSAHASVPYTQANFRDGDCLLFGSESRGLPPSVLERYRDRAFVIPMPTGKVRSLNLATAVGIVLYEALRQLQSWQPDMNHSAGG
jgi:tRNA (cytidine/uridine-2'-O-)-methyltransferase